MSSENWPPALKYDLIRFHCGPRPDTSTLCCREWVARCLGQMTDSNREEASTELRKVISDSFMDKTLWTTDWNGVQLQRYLLPVDRLAPQVLFVLIWCFVKSPTKGTSNNQCIQ